MALTTHTSWCNFGVADLERGSLLLCLLLRFCLFCMPVLSSGMYCDLCIPGQMWDAHLALLSLAVGPWPNCLTSLSLHFLICKIVILYHPEVGLILLEKKRCCAVCVSRGRTRSDRLRSLLSPWGHSLSIVLSHLGRPSGGWPWL